MADRSRCDDGVSPASQCLQSQGLRHDQSLDLVQIHALVGGMDLGLGHILGSPQDDLCVRADALESGHQRDRTPAPHEAGVGLVGGAIASIAALTAGPSIFAANG